MGEIDLSEPADLNRWYSQLRESAMKTLDAKRFGRRPTSLGVRL